MVSANEQHIDAEVIAVIGPTGGSAKTTTAVNLAVALAAAGRTVLLVDLDPRGNAGDTLVRGSGGLGGSYRLLTETILSREMLIATEIPDLYLLPADERLAGLEGELALEGDSRTRLTQGLQHLKQLTPQFDVVIIDSPPALGLLTLNVIGAADRVLMTVAADYYALEGVPALLKAVQRLRAGLSRPLQGVHLLGVLSTDTDNSRSLLAEMRREYGRMTLQVEIPWSEVAREAASRGKPLLAHNLRSHVSHAYLGLAAEWLGLSEQQEGEGPWRYKARQEAMVHARQTMEQRIGAWLVDPSSLLYDEQEAQRHEDGEVLEALYNITTPVPKPQRQGKRIALVALLLLAIAIPLLLTQFPLAPEQMQASVEEPLDQLRLEAGALVIGKRQHWQAGSALLARSDEGAYRELVLGARLIESNRQPLLECGRRARQEGGVVPCTVEVGPWR